MYIRDNEHICKNLLGINQISPWTTYVGMNKFRFLIISERYRNYEKMLIFLVSGFTVSYYVAEYNAKRTYYMEECYVPFRYW